METSEKTRRLVLLLEGVAIATALVLILIDYKLKNDLVELYKKMEAALEDGKRIFGDSFGSSVDLDSVRAGHVVDIPSPVETSASPSSNGSIAPNGKTQPARRTSAKRSGRVGNTQVPEPDKPVGT